MAKEGGVPLSGYWIYGAGLILTMLVLVFGGVASARQGTSSPIPSENND